MVVYRSRRGVETPAPVTSLQLHALACSTMRITISILCHYIPHYIQYHTSSELHALTRFAIGIHSNYILHFGGCITFSNCTR